MLTEKTILLSVDGRKDHLAVVRVEDVLKAAEKIRAGTEPTPANEQDQQPLWARDIGDSEL